ncbi:hypothetical protein D3C87_2131860 [compost metagenome]
MQWEQTTIEALELLVLLVLVESAVLALVPPFDPFLALRVTQELLCLLDSVALGVGSCGSIDCAIS